MTTADFPILTTERLVLRQVRAEDSPTVFAFKGNPDVTTQYAREPHASLDQTSDWLQRVQESNAQSDDFMWAVTLKSEERLIGTCLLWNVDLKAQCGELGYELHPDYGRRGMMSEAVAAVVAFGFNELGLHRIEANTFAKNASSTRLLEKLGFTLEGNLRQRVYFRGEYLDQLYYGLLKEEWLQQR